MISRTIQNAFMNKIDKKIGNSRILPSPYLSLINVQNRNNSIVHSERFREVWHDTDSIDRLYEICKKPRAEERYDPTRRAYYYLMTAGVYGTGFTVTRNVIREIISFASPPANVLASQATEVSLNDVAEGKCTVVLVGDDPVFIWHRNAAQIRRAQEQDNEQLRDPEKDDDRCEQPEWLIVSAVCTHFGCVPTFGQGAFGGFFLSMSWFSL